MKQKLLLLLALFVCIQLKVQAQEVFDFNNQGGGKEVVDPFKGIVGPPYSLSIGLKGGLNLTGMTGNPAGVDMGAKMGTGFHAGAIANLHLGRKTESSKGGTGMWGIQAEALYSQLAIGTAGSNMTLNYFALPVLLKCYVESGLSIEAGPTFMALLSSSPDNMVVNGTSIALSGLKGGDIALSIGAGYELKSGLCFGARYNIGMSDLAGNMPCRTNVIQISLGYLFSVVK